MIGNDIIDLQQAKKESNWKRPNFLQKLFTPAEQAFILRATDSDQAIWLLWSRKESVYKIVARLQQRRFFAPKKLVNTTLVSNPDQAANQYPGKIVFANDTFRTTSVVTDTFIHTIAQLDQDDQPCSLNSFYLPQSTYKTQRQVTRQELLQDYAQRVQVSPDTLSIQKDKWTTPHVFWGNKKQQTVVSISHHGYYGAYAMQLPPGLA